MEFTPTPEQERAVELFRSGGSLKIEAGAGTGKTSTLVLLAREAGRQQLSGQYLAFNKAIVVDAGAKLPGNVQASTAHSLAFRAVGRRYSHRLQSNRQRAQEIARHLRIDSLPVKYGMTNKTLAAGYLAGLVMRSVQIFSQSADPQIGEQHVPYVDGIDMPDANGRRTYAQNDRVRHHVAPYLRAAWADIENPDGVLRFTHDNYLKIWALGRPRIPADVIFLDEAQDTNPVLLDVFESQEHAQRVLVGDAQQQIYAWRGAMNAMERADTDHRTLLTQSFRFGPEIAEVANDVLSRIKGADIRLIGSPHIASTVGPIAEPDCVLTRTNSGAVTRLLEAQADGRTVHLVGGGSEVLAFARGAEQLMRDGFSSHPELACFSSWDEVRDYVEHDQQGDELRLLVKLIEEFGTQRVIGSLERMPSEDVADVVISTAHKSKGREWNSVQLAHDFPSGQKGYIDDELRLLYVAVTRARRELDISHVGLFSEDEEVADDPSSAVPEDESRCKHCDGELLAVLHGDGTFRTWLHARGSNARCTPSSITIAERA